MSKIWLIGLDGASFDILQPMLDSGRLPVLDKLIKTGASAVLKSNIAPVTPQAWASVLTGNNPGKHGVFGFIRQLPGKPPEFLSSKSMHGDKLWTWFGRAGLTSMIINVPLSYPPEPINGSMITGMMTPSIESDFTYPSELKARILSEYPNYRLDIKAGIGYSRNLDMLDELEDALAVQVKLIKTLVAEQNPDLLFTVFILPDRIQHTYSQFINPESSIYDTEAARKRRLRIWDSYARLDRALGDLLAEAPADTDIILISDHGFTMERGAFYTNDFLAHLGLLKLRTSSGRGAVRSVIRRLNVPQIKRWLPTQVFPAARSLTKEAIDWSQTVAYASPVAQQGVFVNLVGRTSEGIVSRTDYERIRDEIIEAVVGVLDTARQPIIKAYKREELFSGPFMESVPDVVLSPVDPGIETKEMVLGGDFLTYTDGGSRGRHARDGIFIAHGPHINSGNFSELLLEDIAPNVLSLSRSIEVPKDIDGRLRPDIFAPAEALVKLKD